MSFKIKSIAILLLFQLSNIYSQELIPPINNFNPNEYEAAAQNWDIDIDNKGYIYIANNQGLLSYDGLKWSRHKLPGNNVIRSVHIKDSLIYTGAYNEFGYWKKDSKGDLIYTSLKSKTKDFSLDEEIWQIISIGDLLYLRSFGKIYLYDGDEISIQEDVNSNTMISYKNQLFVADRQKGLSILKNNSTNTILNKSDFDGERILDFAKYKGKLIIATENKIFEYSDFKIKPIGNKSLWENLKKWELNKIEMIDSTSISIGTVKNGVIIYNLSTDESQILNRLNGLQNNTVLSQKYFNNQLWIGLDYGVDKIELNSPISFFTESTGELGSVYDIEFIDNETYLGSNTGVYKLKDKDLEIINGTQGHTWNLNSFNDSLFINHNSGTYIFGDNKLNHIEKKTGSFKIEEINDSSEFLLGTYTGLKHYKDSITIIPDFGLPIRDLIFENDSEGWLLTLYNGLFKVDLDLSLKSFNSFEKIEIPNGNIDSNTRIVYIKNQLAIFNKGKWFKFNPFENKLESFKDFKFLENKKPIFNDGNLFWFHDINRESFHITNFENFQVDLNSSQLKNRLVKNYENVVYKNDSTYLITLKDGFSQIDLKKFENYTKEESFQKPEIVGIRSDNNKFDLHTKTFSYKDSRDLYFDIAYPYQTNGLVLKYRLKSNETLRKGTFEAGILNFQNLYEGDYQIDFYVEDTRLGMVNLDSFEFTISPPWYLSIYMKVLYILIAVFITYSVYRINKMKLNKHKDELVEVFERHKQEELKKQEKKKLIEELNFKSKELANTTLAIAKKNEILLELKKELKDSKNTVSNNYKLKKIVSKINNALNNRNEWDVFETNFNEIHDEFFKKLLKSYPDLTNSDLKLCAYLKMNMTSKEIAPLLRISLRGVEVHRYRLRKKLNLESNQNLNNFLIKNF